MFATSVILENKLWEWSIIVEQTSIDCSSVGPYLPQQGSVFHLLKKKTMFLFPVSKVEQKHDKLSCAWALCEAFSQSGLKRVFVNVFNLL